MEFVSILLPAHNEAPRIYHNLHRVCAVARTLCTSQWRDFVSAFEVIVVDDGSTDSTWSEIQRAARELPELITLQLPSNYGKGWALRKAFERSRGSWIFFIDADLEIDPGHMQHFVSALRAHHVHAVLGSKRAATATASYPFYRRVISLAYALLVRLLVPVPVRDTQTGFKLFTRPLLEAVMPRMLVRRYAFDIELLALAHRLGFRCTSCPVTVSFSNKRGSATLANVYHMFIDTLAVFYRLRLLKYYDSWQPKDYSYTPRVSVIIAVKDDNPYLRQCVTTTLQQDYPDFEIIVVPDNPIVGFDPRVRIIPSGPELPAVKRNLGAKLATGDILAFLDDDAYPYGNWLRELAANFAHPDVGAVGGPGVTPPEDSFWQQVSGAVYSSYATSGVYRYRYTYDRRREVDDFPTCNLAVRSSVFAAANGFQTNYWPGEDTELCLTITKKLGARIIYDPLVEVLHHRRSLWNGHFKQVTQYALHRGFFVKKFPATSRRLSYFMPTFFTLGCATGWITWWLYRPLFFAYCAVLVIYALFVLACSFLAAPTLTFPTALGTLLTHWAYGIYFLIGLCSPRLSRREERSPHSPTPHDASPQNLSSR
ncbi:MAG: glycosyltransferase [bacterium]|nr:glycosyltransferase [bacterium]